MARNGKVYISAPPGDDPVVAKLLATFKSKRANAWRGPGAADALSTEALRQLEGRDALIRILNARSAAAPNMRLELEEYQRLCAADTRSGAPKRRVIFNLIMDEAYQRQPEDAAADFTITTTNKPESAWLPTIFSEIGQLKMNTTYGDSPVFVLTMVGVVVALAMLGLIAITYLYGGSNLIP